MKVLFDRRSAAGHKTGVGFYASELLDACARVSAEDEVDPFPDGLTWAGYRVHGSLAPVWRRFRSRTNRDARPGSSCRWSARCDSVLGGSVGPRQPR